MIVNNPNMVPLCDGALLVVGGTDNERWGQASILLQKAKQDVVIRGLSASTKP